MSVTYRQIKRLTRKVEKDTLNATKYKVIQAYIIDISGLLKTTRKW